MSDYRPFKETHKLIKKIKSGYKIGLLSNIYKGMLPLLIEKGIIPNIKYDQIIFSCDVGMMKPNPDIYKFAQNKTGLKPGEILLVDDREDYCNGAEKGGWNTFLFNPKQSTSSVKKLQELLNCN